MPNGYWFHDSCIHRHNDSFNVEVLDSGFSIVDGVRLPPCPYKPRRDANEARAMTKLGRLNYYSDWSVYAQAVNSNFSTLSSSWTVPPAPLSHGPADLSSVYIFNGLEDGSGHHGSASLILQPVLQYGKSGCVIDPLRWNEWLFSAYLVDGNGRAHCGPAIKVKTGDEVIGQMNRSGTNTWTVVATHPSSTKSSTFTSDLGDKHIDAAYLTLEGMVIYGCKDYPPGGGSRFTKLSAHDASGDPIALAWSPEVRHSECNQSVRFGDDGSVTLLYDSTL